MQCDVRDVARINQRAFMPKLPGVLADHSCQPVNHSGIGAVLGLDHVMTRKHVGVLETLFLVHTLRSRFTNRLMRLA